MTRFFFIAVITCFTLLICLARQKPFTPQIPEKDVLKEYKAADKLYQDAERLSGKEGFSEEQEDAMNKKALDGFRHVLAMMKTSEKNDSLAFFCYLKTGILEHYFGNLAPAKEAYAACISSKAELPQLADSLLFKPYLYTGSIYYIRDQFDSALLFYKKAELVINKYPVVLTESERLYNTFGNIYLSTGNYKQSKNYFEKAIGVLRLSNPYYKALLINYQINLATSLTKLEEYHRADSIYQSILPYNINTDEILHNSGIINLYMGKSRKALSLFSKVKYAGSRSVRIYNDMATACYNLGRNDSARFYFQKALNADKQFNNERKNTAHGATLKEMGDMFVSEKKYNEAVRQYQEAIIQFDPSFNDSDAKKNPEEYSGIFSYIDLFNTLTAKGDAFREVSALSKSKKDLVAALAAYRSAFQLTGYVEKTYDSDEARLFLNKTKYTIHSIPIDISLQLYELTKDENYLEEAYFFDQRNKASILTLNVQENVLKKENKDAGNIFDHQSSLKSSITRLSLKAPQVTDSLQSKKINDDIRDYEIRLSKIQDTINTDPAYARYRSTEKIPPISAIQHTLLDNKTALLSFHLSKNELLVFTITRNSFDYIRQGIDSDFFQKLIFFIDALHDVSGEKKYNGNTASADLYRQLLLPVLNKLSGITRLIIIPDDELNYLPFEALQDEKGNYLVNSFAVQYQYSTALLGELSAKKQPVNKILGLAPFANSGYTDSSEKTTFNRLANSFPEIKNLQGKILADKQATKEVFLENANHYSIIHLATHASVNEQEPGRSFIAFYPGSKNNLLYAREIYDLNLDSTELIILSACETGSGRLIHGEGMMSLSRAFAYAGCPNIITSLWKAEDKTTAYVARQLHYYLKKGHTRDKALQQAKIDLLNTDEVDQPFKTPNYWAHLVLIDNYEPVKRSTAGWWIAVCLIVTAVATYWLAKRKAWLD